ncbi:hypothetical protein CHU98_g8485 [Xylaria longipes]|nr:hypothetical protein CHU98_g8485 [Xylaria longipes]
MLTNTFANVVANATAEVHFRKAVLTLEGVKSDAIFAYQPPFNILALFILVPMKFLVSPRWFHKIHVATVRTINLPVLLFIAILERRLLWSEYAGEAKLQQKRRHRGKGRFWEKWRITSHGDIHTVFDIPLPDSVEEDIAVDDELTRHMIRRQFLRHHGSTQEQPRDSQVSGDTDKDKKEPPTKPPSRRDSIAPYGLPPEQVRSMLGETGQPEDLAMRLANLERTSSKIEEMLESMRDEIVPTADRYLEVRGVPTCSLLPKTFGTENNESSRDSVPQGCAWSTTADRNCGHHWLAIRQPCWPGYGFTYCGVFGDGVAREPSPEFEIMGLCPACATPGYYDRNLVRMVTNVRERCRWGIGPFEGRPGG